MEWKVDERGLRHDRRWMLVDESGNLCLSAVPAHGFDRGSRRARPSRRQRSEMPSLEVPFLPDGKPVLTSVWGTS